MGGTRAVIASLGASISIVACAALGLFAVSVLFALPGIAGSLNGSVSSQALVVATRASSADAKRAVQSATAKPLVVTAPKVAVAPRPRRAAPARHGSSGVRSTSGASRATRPAATSSSVPTIAAVTQPPAVSPPAATVRRAGDGVRALGDTLTGTVQRTGNALGAATKLLGPPVSNAVQTVLNRAVQAVNDLLKRTTGGLAGVLDATKP